MSLSRTGGLASLLVLLACGSTSVVGVDPPTDGSAPPPSGTPTGTPTTPPPPPPPPGDAGTDGPRPAQGLRFVAVGDTGKGTPGQQSVADAIAAKCQASGCDFVQLLGDNIYESGVTSADDPLLQSRFEIPYAKVNAPFFVVLGNHDYGANGLGTEFGKGKNEVDYTAKSTKWKLPAAYYHHVKGDAEFFALDTNLILFNRADNQKSDFPGWISASKSIWKIAFGHHPYLSNGPHGNAGNYDGIPLIGATVKSFFDDTICGKTDVYISGHDHSTQWLEPTCAGTELIVAGAGAEGTSLTSRNKSRFQTANRSFFYIVLEGKKLTAEVIDEAGAVRFTRTLTKP